MDGYELVLSEVAAVAFAMASRSEQRKLATLLDTAKTAPFRPGDLQERDATGRLNEVLIAGDWLVTYWTDHAAREIRIVRLERAED